MLDEPLGFLTAICERLVKELHDILKDMYETAIYVTYDQGKLLGLLTGYFYLTPGDRTSRPPVEITCTGFLVCGTFSRDDQHLPWRNPYT
jgi:hypothetical protein